MKRVVFRLSMPNVASWNGKWSGAGKNYVIVKKLTDKIVSELGITEEKGNSWYYGWDYGWGAEVSARIAQKGERMKKSDGFCGYGWMVDNILAYGSPYGKPKEVNGYEEESNELDVYAPEVSE